LVDQYRSWMRLIDLLCRGRMMVAQSLQERLSFASLGSYLSWRFLMTHLQSGGHRIWDPKHRRKLGCGSLSNPVVGGLSPTGRGRNALRHCGPLARRCQATNNPLACLPLAFQCVHFHLHPQIRYQQPGFSRLCLVPWRTSNFVC
jgi:hypothetical protein